MKRMIKITLVLNILYTPNIYAGIKGFDKHVKNLGFMSNVTSPGVVEDQRAGYYTGGGLVMKGQVSDTQLAHIDLPSIKAGCGGIDLYGGGFGFIKLDEIKKLGQNIVQNSIGYAAEIAIDTISPMISTSLNRMRSIANAINSQNINSCNISAGIVGGMFPKNEAARRIGCQAKSEGGMADYFTSRLDCSTRDEKEIDKPADAGDEMESLLGSEFNLVYKALLKTEVKEDLRNTLMSVSGTLIAKINGEGKQEFTFKPSLFKSAESIAALLYGDKAAKGEIYSCHDGDKCLELKKDEITLAQDNSIVGKVNVIMRTLATKIMEDKSELTEEEKKLIQSSNVPILKLLTMDIALKGQDSGAIASEYSETIAYDLLINYLEEMLDIVYRAVNELEHAQFDGENIERFKQEVRDVREELKSKRDFALKRLNNLIIAKQHAMMIEKKLRYHAAEILTIENGG